MRAARDFPRDFGFASTDLRSPKGDEKEGLVVTWFAIFVEDLQTMVELPSIGD